MNATPADLTYQEFQELADELRSAAAAYYSGDGSQRMDDLSYDKGIRRLQTAATEHGWSDELLDAVAGGQGSGTVKHDQPMLSLDNCFDDDDLLAFIERVSKKSGIPAADLTWAVEPKFDGMMLAVSYVAGSLARIVTRGDGQSGEDVSHWASDIKGVPSTLLASNNDTITVVGECVMSEDDFAEANKARATNGKTPFANPRNAVAGALRSLHRQYVIPLTFVAHGIVGGDEGRLHTTTMSWLGELGFETSFDVVGFTEATGTDEVLTRIAHIESQRASFAMDTDGAVIKANDPMVRKAMGEGSRAPRWAIARKFAPDTRQTALRNIAVEVGRTGNLSFTAELEPVFVGGTTITYASVHNPSVIAEKGLRLPKTAKSAPQQVIVRRAGEVIPQIVGAANEDNLKTTVPFTPPTECPRCGSDLDTSGLVWKCIKGRDCVTAPGLIYAVSRDCLDVEGLGSTHIEALVESGELHDLADLFALTEEQLLTVPRLGQSNARKILAGIEAAKTLPLARLVAALGIRGTGRSMSRRIAAHFDSLSAIRSATVEQIAEVEGLGEVKAPSIVAELAELAPMLDRLDEMGLGKAPAPASDSGASITGSLPLEGMAVCVTGAMTGPLAGKSRNEVNELIESLGGRASSSVSAKTAFLLTADGDSGTGKSKKAAELGVRIVSPEEFAAEYL